MSTFSLMRVYLQMQKTPRLPVIGNAGIYYASSLIDRNRTVYKKEVVETAEHPENGGAMGILSNKTSFGSFIFRRYSTSVEDIKKAEKEREQKNKFKLKSEETIKVLLVSETGSITAVTLIEANKIAKKKGLYLVHIENDNEKPIKSEKEVYKLVSKLTSIDEESEPVKEKDGRKEKELKTVIMKSSIAEHDALSKINQMQKWVKKGHRIRVLIGQAGNKGDAEAIFTLIETKMGEAEGQVQQKVKKGNEIRFYVGPSKKQKSSTGTSPVDKKGKGEEYAT